jgi:hypothetical protein
VFILFSEDMMEKEIEKNIRSIALQTECMLDGALKARKYLRRHDINDPAEVAKWMKFFEDNLPY